MKRILTGLAGLLAILAIAGGMFWTRYLRDLPPIRMALLPLDISTIETPASADCFWMGPVSFQAFNLAFPDEGAVYWPAAFSPPSDGDHLEITGAFPMARYLSFNTYQQGAVPHDSVTDQDIAPDEGLSNPFQTGTHRPAQTYTLRVVPGDAPETRAPNTLYFGPAGSADAVPLILRLYLPETAQDTTGGAGLPRVALVRANGERLTGDAMCAALGSAALGSPDRRILAPVIPQADYRAFFDNPEVRDALLASPNGTWSVFWGPRLAVLRTAAPGLARWVAFGARLGLIPRESGFYANRDTAYVSTYVNESFGEVVVLQGRLPRTPARGVDTASGAHELRYWSLCTNEGLASTRYADCVHDAQVVVDAARNYTIVISKRANRPANATADCGVTWLDWGDSGDGAGNDQLGILIIRNMLPAPGFAQAIQRIAHPGDEAAVMGPYLPVVSYSDRPAFEARGC